MFHSDRSSPRWYLPFFTIWSGQVFSLLGSTVVQFALIWWLTQTTGSGAVLAAATLAGMLPGIIIGPLAGVYVDRWNRRLVMIFADGLVALIALWLAYVFWRGNATVWYIYLALLIRGLGGAFHFPAMQASTSLMVPKSQLTRIAGMNQTLHGLMNIFGPPLGALLIAWMPIWAILLIDVVTALVAIIPLLFVTIPQPHRIGATGGIRRSQSSIWFDLVAGFRYVVNWPGALILFGMAMAINFLLTPTASLLPLLVTRYFQGGAIHLAGFESAWGIGMVVGGLLLSVWGGFKRRIYTSLMGLSLLGVGILIVGAAPSWALWMAVAGFFIGGVMIPITNGPLYAIVQASVRPDMQGRVLTLVGSLISVMSPLSLAIAGPVSDLTGVRPLFIASGLLCLSMGVAGFFIPALVHLEEHPGTAVSTIEIGKVAVEPGIPVPNPETSD